MEKLPHQEYRDELAGKLKEIRNSDPKNPEVSKAKALGYLEAKKEPLEYAKGEIDHFIGNIKTSDFIKETNSMSVENVNDFYLNEVAVLENHYAPYDLSDYIFQTFKKSPAVNGEIIPLLVKNRAIESDRRVEAANKKLEEIQNDSIIGHLFVGLKFKDIRREGMEENFYWNDKDKKLCEKDYTLWIEPPTIDVDDVWNNELEDVWEEKNNFLLEHQDRIPTQFF